MSQQISGHISDEVYGRLLIYVAKRRAQDKKVKQEKILEQALQEFLDRADVQSVKKDSLVSKED